jgi:hypothetical protein
MPTRIFSRRSIAKALTPWAIPRYIFIACFPKSGSSYLELVLRQLTGFRYLNAVLAFGHNEQDLYEFKLRENRHDSVVRLHTRAGQHNLKMVERYGLRPVILVRNIFDVVVSVHDHLQETPAVPMGYVHREWFDMDRDRRLMFIIQTMLPWYFGFLMSWREAHVSTHWITYEQLFSDPVGIVSGVLEFSGLPADREQIERGVVDVPGEKTRFNVGRSGRGATLSPEHAEAIHRLRNVWAVDAKEWELIGL